MAIYQGLERVAGRVGAVRTRRCHGLHWLEMDLHWRRWTVIEHQCLGRGAMRGQACEAEGSSASFEAVVIVDPD